MYSVFFKGYKGMQIYDILEKENKLSLFRMLYFKSSPNPIPSDELKQLEKDGWLISENGYFTWSFKANQLHSLVNQISDSTSFKIEQKIIINPLEHEQSK